MFSEDELKHIYESITDTNLKTKIHSMLFVNSCVVKDIIEHFSKDNLFRIEKSPEENTYYVHKKYAKEATTFKCVEELAFFDLL